MDTNLLIEQVGRLHPIILHFPIVLITLIPIILLADFLPFLKKEWLAPWKKIVPVFIHAGALSAWVATVLGFFLANNRPTLSSVLTMHRASAIATVLVMTAFSVTCFLVKPKFEEKIPVWAMLFALAGAALVGLTGHLGGLSVHGDFLILFDAAE